MVTEQSNVENGRILPFEDPIVLLVDLSKIQDEGLASVLTPAPWMPLQDIEESEPFGNVGLAEVDLLKGTAENILDTEEFIEGKLGVLPSMRGVN